MTFRVDDLLIAVFPEGAADNRACPENTTCLEKTGGNTGTNCQDPNSQCTPRECEPNTDVCPVITDPEIKCHDDSRPGQPGKKGQAWRDEQFALLSRELEEALAR